MKSSSIISWGTASLLIALSLSGCSDPGTTQSAAAAKEPSGFNLGPDQQRTPAAIVSEAQDLVPEAIKKDGKLSIAVAPGSAPLMFFATDNKTVIGSEADIAIAVAQSLGLEPELIPVAWADWPLGLESGKYEAVASNITVTEVRKKKYDFSTYREDKLGFYVPKESKITKITEPKDVAGLRIVVGSGTNQEKILLTWDKENTSKGLKPIDFQYYDDDSLATIALYSGRADASFGPNATGAYKAVTDSKTRMVGLLPGGWPQAANIGLTVRKDSGLAEAAQVGIDGLIDSGLYKEILDKWSLGDEGIEASELNPEGLKD